MRMFKNFRAEVEALGAAALDGADKKEYEARRLKALGASLPKSPKVPIHILKGMKEKMERKNYRLGQEAASMASIERTRAVQAKTMVPIFRCTQAAERIAKQQDKDRHRDRGLQHGNFRDGTLKLTKQEVSSFGIKAQGYQTKFRAEKSTSSAGKGGRGGKGAKGSKGGKGGKGGKGKR